MAFTISSTQQIPASVLLMQLLQSQTQQAESMHYGVALIPTFSVGVDIMGIGVVLVSIMGLFGVAKGCRQLMNLYFGLVLVFIGVQVGNAFLGFFSGSDWIQEALEKSWSRAYEADNGLIRDLQNEFHCQGFHTQEDRSAPMPIKPEIYLPPCAEILETQFGQRLQRLGSIVLCIRLIQLTGVFLLSMLFKHLAAVDQIGETEEKQADEESSYFKSEKQIEDENARVPLLAEDLLHYSTNNINGDDYYTESDDSYEDDDENDDEEKRHGGRGRCTSDYEYRELPKYAEDERETQVYVA
ncbi:hypothetical protein BGX27_009665 [Mortierella sp. AM989]|nr:hypothetical protein BGX27_009665 [Mortierella sp. AM989]